MTGQGGGCYTACEDEHAVQESLSLSTSYIPPDASHLYLPPLPVARSLRLCLLCSCFGLPNYDTTLDDLQLRSRSPWFIARDCYWPVDDSDTNTCTFDSKPTGMYHCLNNLPGQSVQDYRYCGSSFDAAGGWVG